MTQQSYYWAYNQRKPQFRKTHAPQCSLQHYLQSRAWKQPNNPSAEEWIKKMWYIYRMKY